jgi:predicted DNA-binding protein
MKTRSFRLEEEDIDLLKKLSEERGETQAETIHSALIKLQGDTADAVLVEDGIDWQKLYFEEKQQAAKANERLYELSNKMAESLQAAQALQAMDRPQLSEAKEKHPWWKFWT